MTNALTQARLDAKALLEDAGLFAFTVVPDVAAPPMVWVAPALPYLTFDGAGFGGGRILHLDLVAAVDSGVNEVQADSLDDLLLQICDAVDAAPQFEFVLGDVGQPGQIGLNGQSHLACAVSVTREIHP